MPQPPYQVRCSQVVAESLRQLQRRASRAGYGELVLEAFRLVVERLKADPSELGEPLYRLPVLRMQVRLGIVPPLVVDFAVSEDHPLVIIRGIKSQRE